LVHTENAKKPKFVLTIKNEKINMNF